MKNKYLLALLITLAILFATAVFIVLCALATIYPIIGTILVLLFMSIIIYFVVLSVMN